MGCDRYAVTASHEFSTLSPKDNYAGVKFLQHTDNKSFYLSNPIGEYVNDYAEQRDKDDVLSYLWQWWEIEKIGKEDDGGDFQTIGQARVLMSQNVHARPRKRIKRVM